MNTLRYSTDSLYSSKQTPLRWLAQDQLVSRRGRAETARVRVGGACDCVGHWPALSVVTSRFCSAGLLLRASGDYWRSTASSFMSLSTRLVYVVLLRSTMLIFLAFKYQDSVWMGISKILD
jgi:hypothetical protein